MSMSRSGLDSNLGPRTRLRLYSMEDRPLDELRRKSPGELLFCHSVRAAQGVVTDDAETAVLLQISRCDLAKFRNVHFESFSLRCSSREGLVYQPPTSRRGGRGCPAQRSAARALERRARPPGVRPLSPVCATPLVGQFGGRRTNPEARLLERRRHPSS